MKISRRMERERKTFQAMLSLYCKDVHASETLCGDCEAHLAYAMGRLEKCPFQEGKTTCANCPIHCYRDEMRARTREVMRYAGPRMLLRHPCLALAHLVDGLQKKPRSFHGKKGLSKPAKQTQSK